VLIDIHFLFSPRLLTFQDKAERRALEASGFSNYAAPSVLQVRVVVSLQRERGPFFIQRTEKAAVTSKFSPAVFLLFIYFSRTFQIHTYKHALFPAGRLLSADVFGVESQQERPEKRDVVVYVWQRRSRHLDLSDVWILSRDAQALQNCLTHRYVHLLKSV